MKFVKMHGLGNDFIIFDGRYDAINLTKSMVKALADRNKGIGCDQIAIIGSSTSCYATLDFWNSDGTRSDTCGNATRCIGDILFQETNSNYLTLETNERKIECKRDGKSTSVNMGNPLTEWHDSPLSKKVNTMVLDLDGSPTATSMGNPHCTFFVNDFNSINIETVGSNIQKCDLFPQGTNVQFAKIIDRNHVKAKIWERGSGVTLSSGSSSCAITAAGVRRGLLDKMVEIESDGGKLSVNWKQDGIWIKGSTTVVFQGVVSKKFLEEIK